MRLYERPELLEPGNGVDFHMHTTASDGLWGFEELAKTAHKQGLRVMTVSDHDTLGGVRPVQEAAAQYGVKVIPGVEITIDWRGKMYHMLALNYHNFAAIQTLMDDTQERSNANVLEMVAALRKAGNKLPNFEEEFDRASFHKGRQVFQALTRSGSASNNWQAVQACERTGLLQSTRQPAEIAIHTVLEAGGLPILAHPGREEQGFEVATTEVLSELVEMGLAGVEVYHYSHGEKQIDLYKNFAKQNGLVISAGSDSHGSSRLPTPWKPELVRDLLERLNLESTVRA